MKQDLARLDEAAPRGRELADYVGGRRGDWMGVGSGPGRSGSERDGAWDAWRTDTLAGAVQYVFGYIRRQRWMLVLGVLLGCLLAPISYFMSAPMYDAVATILLDTSKIQIFQQPAVVGEVPIESSLAIESQIAVLRSERIIHAVMERLDLVGAPEFAVSERGRIARWLGKDLAAALGRSPIRTDAQRARYRADAFASGLTIRRVPGTYAVEVWYRSGSAERAALVANAIAQAYITEQLEAKKDVNRQAGNWLQDRLRDLRAQLSETQRAAIEFKSSNKLFATGGHQVVEKRITELNSQLLATRDKANEAQARLDRIEEAISTYQTAKVKPALPDQMTNPVVSKLREQYLELTNREAEWSVKYGRHHQSVEKLGQRRREIQAALLDEFNRLAESYRSELQIVRQREGNMDTALHEAVNQLHAAEQAGIKLRELETSAQTVQVLHDGFLRRHSEATEQEAFGIARARILNEATEPLVKSWKKTTKAAMLLVMAGLGLGLGASLVREMSDRTFRRLNDVEHVLGKSLLSIVPLAGTRAAPEAAASADDAAPDNGCRTIKRRKNLMWTVDRAPRSAFAESIRTVKHQLDQRIPDHGCKVIGVTSALPSEGSSTVASGIAVCAAKLGARVLLIDGDLRHPSLSRQITPRVETGLVDVMLGDVELEQAIWTDAATGLAFLPAGVRHGTIADEMMASQALRNLIRTAKSRYDYVIFDFPPLVPMVDVLMTTDVIPYYVAVIKWGSSEKEVTRIAYDRSESLDERVIGVVYNQVDLKNLQWYDPHVAQWFDRTLYRNYAAHRG